MKAELIAPCGMNCRLCYGYVRKRKPCAGCLGPDELKPKSCTSCKIIQCEKRRENNWATCALCDTPCKRLKDLDKRYRANYHMSMVENLAEIKQVGMDVFLASQKARFTCSACGGIVSVHRQNCPTCDTPVDWKE